MAKFLEYIILLLCAAFAETQSDTQAFIKIGVQLNQLGNQITNLIKLSDNTFGFGYCIESQSRVTYEFMKLTTALQGSRSELGSTTCGMKTIVEDKSANQIVILITDKGEPFLWIPWARTVVTNPKVSIVAPAGFSFVRPQVILASQAGQLLFGGNCVPTGYSASGVACVGTINSNTGTIPLIKTQLSYVSTIVALIETVPTGNGFLGVTLDSASHPVLLVISPQIEITQTVVRPEVTCQSSPIQLINTDGTGYMLTCAGISGGSSIMKLTLTLGLSSTFTTTSEVFYTFAYVEGTKKAVSFGTTSAKQQVSAYEYDLTTATARNLAISPPTWGSVVSSVADLADFYLVGTNGDNRLYALKVRLQTPVLCVPNFVSSQNELCAPLLTTGCHKACDGKCIEANNRLKCHQGCNWQNDTALETLAFMGKCQCKLEYAWSEEEGYCKRQLYKDCHVLCGGICLAANNASQCASDCVDSSIEPQIDSSKITLNQCGCLAPYAYNANLSRCSNNTQANNGTNITVPPTNYGTGSPYSSISAFPFYLLLLLLTATLLA